MAVGSSTKDIVQSPPQCKRCDISFDLDGGKVVAVYLVLCNKRREKSRPRFERAQPHIVLFTVDDMGWNDVGFHSTDLPNATEYMNELVRKYPFITVLHAAILYSFAHCS